MLATSRSNQHCNRKHKILPQKNSDPTPSGRLGSRHNFVTLLRSQNGSLTLNQRTKRAQPPCFTEDMARRQLMFRITRNTRTLAGRAPQAEVAHVILPIPFARSLPHLPLSPLLVEEQLRQSSHWCRFAAPTQDLEANIVAMRKSERFKEHQRAIVASFLVTRLFERAKLTQSS